MSRIEDALEQALKARQRERVAREQPAPGPKPRQRFVAGEEVVDRAKVDRHLVTISDPQSAAAEQYWKLRARVLRDTGKAFHNTIMVTSSDLGEGKTLTAVNLAVAIANELDKTVLLVDADLRNPMVHRYLGLEQRQGLGEYLRGEAVLSDLLIKTGIGKLVFLPAGHVTGNTSELISSDKMRAFVQDAKGRYADRYVIFDSSPMLLTADPLSLSNHVDCVLFVVQAERTIPKAATRALSLLKGCPVLGVVFNNVPKHLTKALFPYYFRYGQYQRVS